jgi:hypothetical protein
MTSGDEEQSENADGAGNAPVVDMLDGIPGIGPTRRSALTAAGITTAESLRALGAAELARLTRMPRAQADRILASLSDGAEAPAPAVETPPSPPPPENLPEELASAETPEPVPTIAPVPSSPEKDGDENVTLARVRNAVSALARREGYQHLARPFARLQLLLDDLSEKAATLKPKQAKLLEKRLTALAAQFEKTAERDKPLRPKAEKRFRARLREERRTIAGMLAHRPRRMTKKAVGAKASATKKKKS